MKTINKAHNKFGKIVRLTACIIFLSLLSLTIFECIHAGHENFCNEDDCPICLVLQVIHNTNKISHTAPKTSVEFSAFNYINLFILSALFLAPATLVKQKVKLVI